MVKLETVTDDEGYRIYKFDSKLEFSEAKDQILKQFAEEKRYTYDDKAKVLKVGNGHVVHVVQFYEDGFKVLKAVENGVVQVLTSVLYGATLENLLTDAVERKMRDHLLSNVKTISDYKNEAEANPNDENLKGEIEKAYEDFMQLNELVGKVPDLLKKYNVLKTEYEDLLKT